MSTDIRLTTEGEIDLTTGGGPSLVSGVDEKVQRLATRLTVFQGEWFLDLTKGIPYIPRIFAKSVPDADIVAIYRFEAETMDGIVAVDDISLEITATRRGNVELWVTPEEAILEPVSLTVPIIGV
jgi:hypothetical protein